MRSDAFIRVECDGCGHKTYLTVVLPAGVGGCYIYNEAAVTRNIGYEDWKVVDGRDFCPACAEKKGGEQ